MCWKMKKRNKRLKENRRERLVFGAEGTPRRKKHLPLFALIGLSVLACVFYYATYFPQVVWIRNGKSGLRIYNNGTNSAETEDGKKVESIVCRFPKLNPLDPTIQEYIKTPPNVDCAEKYPMLFRTNFEAKLIRMKDLENTTCCYKFLSRGNSSDTNIRYSKRCFPILSNITEIPPSHEFIYVRCNSNMHDDNISGSGSSTSSSGSNSTVANPTSVSNNVNSTRSKSVIIHKDMFAFVHLKPEVETRIEQYEIRKALKEGEDEKKKNQYRQSSSSPADGVNANKDATTTTKDKENTTKSGSTNRHSNGNSNEDRLNVLILGLDAQSHMNFIRQMPLSFNFLVKNLSAIGMYGYTKVGDNTFPNIIPLLTGLTVSELKKVCWSTKSTYFDNCPFLWKNYSAKGYRTSFAEDSVWMGTFNYEKKGFMSLPTDYYIHPLTYLMSKKIGHETWGNAKLCYGPRLGFEVLLDYAVKTAVTFRNKLYFQYIWANSLFHDYLNNPKLGDNLLYLTLSFLEKNNFLNNTVFVLLSDHGIRWGSIRSTYQGKLEERMPLAYFAFPKWFHRKYSKVIKNLENNSMRLTTPFDVHETLKDILNLGQISTKQDVVVGKEIVTLSQSGKRDDSSIGSGSRDSSDYHDGDRRRVPRGISLFTPIPLSRTCKMAGIEEHWCVCDSMQLVPKNSTVVQTAAKFIMHSINQILQKYPDCAKLRVSKINEAMRKIDGDFDIGSKIDLTGNMKGLISLGNGSSINYDNKHIMNSFSNFFPSTATNTNKTEEIKQNQSKSQSQNKNEVQKSKVQNEVIQLQITLVAKPSDAVFEATVYGKVSGKSWKLSGDISRLNLYRSQSTCVAEPFIQKYCFCNTEMNFSSHLG